MKPRTGLILYALLFAGALILLPWVGCETVSLSDLLAHLRGEHSIPSQILLQQRVPRVLLALIVGGALAACGTSLQVMFRNPLAEPWTLGVAGGASLGAFLARLLPLPALGPLTATQLFAALGAAAVLVLIYTVARGRLGLSPSVLLLAGVTISFFSGGLVAIIIYFVSPFDMLAHHRWTVGGLDVTGYRDIMALAPPMLVGLALLASQAREYNHLALGEEMAAGHGVNVNRTHVLTFVGVGLATAACVAMAGPIAFVGMLVPHAVRRLTGHDHRFLLPGTWLVGGVVLAVCDTVARTVLYPTELPVGLVTAALGAPLFLLLLLRGGTSR